MTDEELKEAYSAWKVGRTKPTVSEKIAMLRREFKMTKRVYGRKVNEAGSPHTKEYKTALYTLFSRLFIIEELGIEQKNKLGDQQTLFKKK